MADATTTPPDVLVLGGGGVLGEAWMSGVLAGIHDADGFDACACGGYVGTSAGSIVAAWLVAGIGPAERLGSLASTDPADQAALQPQEGLLGAALGTAFELGGAALAPLASLAFASTAPGGALLRRAALRRLPAGRRSLAPLRETLERAGAHWDERLRISAVEVESGRRVMLTAGSTPRLSVSQAVAASCAIPGVFRPVRAGGRTYVDGGVWSPTNMDAADVRPGHRVLCMNPTGALRPTVGAPAGALGPLSRAITAAEALTLRHRGASVTTVNPDGPSSAAMGANLMDPDPRRRREVIAAAIAQGRRLAVAGPRRRAA